jgi:hypothetical protein
MEELTREVMIRDLTKFEIEYLIGDNHLLNEMIEFFSKGGFTIYDDKHLKTQHDIIFKD